MRGARSLAAVGALKDAGGELELEELAKIEGPTIKSAVKRLSEKGVVFIDEREDRRSAEFKTLPAAKKPFPLNDQQQAAYDAICSEINKPYLLHGVTGAGNRSFSSGFSSTI